MNRHVSRVAAIAIIGMALVAAQAGPAFAWSQVIFNGFTASYQGERAPNRHSLTAADADRTGGNDQACVNALNDNNGQWAGDTYCHGDYTSHPYCGCQLRWGYNFDGGQWTNPNHINYGVNVLGIQYY